MFKYKYMDSGSFKNSSYEENFDDFVIRVFPGGFCEFNELYPANGLHCHTCYELCIVTEGYGKYTYNNTSIDLKIGDFFIADPGIMHEISVTKIEGCKRLSLIYFLIQIGEIADGKLVRPESLILHNFLMEHSMHKSGQNHLVQYLRFIEDYSCFSNVYSVGFQRTVMSLILDSLLSLSHEKIRTEKVINPYPSLLDSAIGYIMSNLLNKPSIKQIACYAKTSPRNLQYMFRKYLNKSVIQFINERKMSMAAAYLKMSFSVGQVGGMVGIDDMGQFSKTFKKYYGISPQKYQIMFASSSLIENVESK